MSRLIYITFSGAAYDVTTEQIARRAPECGADEVRVYDDAWLMGTEFYRVNKWLWELPGMRGFGWFCWKPFILLHTLDRCESGDVVLFTDGDTFPVSDLRPLRERCIADGGAMVFAAQGCGNRQWVKRDCWDVMAAREIRPGRRRVDTDSPHAVARFMLFQNGPWHVRQFLMEWLTYCVNPLATTFDPSVQTEASGFEQHRTEQAIYSLLCHKYGYNLYREACQFGNAALANGVDNWYPQTFTQIGCTSKGGMEGSWWRNVW